MGDQPTLDFGSDVHSTPISTLQLAPAVTSRGDAPAVAPPVYNPNFDTPPQTPSASAPRRVTFDLPSEEKRGGRDRKRRRDRYQQQQQYYYQPPAEKGKRLFVFLQEYSRHIAIFALVGALLWYYPSLARMPYVGDGNELTLFGILGSALAAAVAFGGAEYVLS